MNRHRANAGILVCCLLSAAACRSVQRVPGPLYWSGEPSDPPPASSFEALVVNHAGAVWVYRPDAPEGYALPYYRKRERVRAGGGVRVGWGGRAELVWPGDATSIVLFEEGRVSLGDPRRDEPLVELKDLTRVRMMLTPEDRIVLPGGAELRGDTVRPSGPFVADRLGAELMRVQNQSKLPGRILFREAVLDLAPGDAITLPILAVGSGPLDPDPARSELVAGGIVFEIVGRVEPREEGGAVRLVAHQGSHVAARGVHLVLRTREEAAFFDLGPSSGGDGEDAGTP